MPRISRELAITPVSVTGYANTAVNILTASAAGASNKSTVVKKLQMQRSDDVRSTSKVDFYIVPSGGSAGAINRFGMFNLSRSRVSELDELFDVVIPPGSSLQAIFQDRANGFDATLTIDLTINLTYVEVEDE